MAEQNLTPEQQLLKHIEASKKDAQATSAGSAPAQPSAPVKSAPETGEASLGMPKSALSVENMRGSFLGRFSFFKRKAKAHAQRKKFRLSLIWLNRLMILAVGCAAMYVTLESMGMAKSMKHSMNFVFQGEKTTTKPPESATSLQDADYYLQKVQARDIFNEGRVGKKEQANKKKEPAAVDAAVSSLSLVGISWSSNPDVIIEDKARQKTYFVKQGQDVGDGVRVEAVFKDHVVLSFDGQEYELR